MQRRKAVLCMHICNGRGIAAVWRFPSDEFKSSWISEKCFTNGSVQCTTFWNDAILSHADLSASDYFRRLELVQLLIHTIWNDSYFPDTILFIDEVTFTREVVINPHNARTRSLENIHTIVMSKVQQKYSVKIWAGIL